MDLLIFAGIAVVLMLFLYMTQDNFMSESEIEAKINCGTKQCGIDQYGNNCGTCAQGYKCLAHQCINDYLAVPYEDY